MYSCGMILVMSLCKLLSLTAVRFCLLLSHTHTHTHTHTQLLNTHTQPVVRIYKVPLDAFEGSGGSEEESDKEASEDEDRGQRSLPLL